ncbi:MAG: TIM-barrel domain-containing protein, partial [Myxococcales bacterium]
MGLGADGLVVTPAADPARVLLRSFAGEGAYAAVATRKAAAQWEMRFGSFKVEEGPQPWRQARGATATGLFPLQARWTGADGGEIATVEITSPSEGALLLTFRAAAADANRTSVAFACEETDRFLGFGAQSDALDHRGHKIPIWTSEPGIGKVDSDDPPELWFLEGARHGSSMGLPTWLSPRGYVGVVESDRRSVFELCSARADAWRVETWGRELKLWLYDGPAPAKALERATAGVLGRPVVPPALAFAPWNDAIYGSDNVRRIAKLIRDERIPSSAIWTEDFRGGHDVPTQGYRLLEEWDTDRSLYPDTEKLSAELRAQGFAWFSYFNTFLVEGTRVYAEAQRDGHFVRHPDGGPYLFDGVTFKPTGLADLSRPETREWVKRYLRKSLDEGFDGWMADYGEWLPHDAVLHSGEDPAEAHNRYAHEWAKLNAEVLAERQGDGRQRLFFSRAGWLRTQTFAPVIWAGDQRTDFQKDDGLPTVITMGLNLGLAGVSTYGHDIAGYQSATNPPATKELFFRWTTLGALSPVMRTHHGIDARKNWWFGSDQ